MTDQTAAILADISNRLARIEGQTKPKLPWLIALPVAAGLNMAIPYLQSTDIPYASQFTNWAMEKESQGITWLAKTIISDYFAPTTAPKNNYKFDSKPHQDELKNVHPDLIAVFNRAQQLAKQQGFRIHVRDGARTHKEQSHYVKIGASKTYNSRHLIASNGYSHAVDLEVKYSGKNTNKKDWYWVRKINIVMQRAAIEQGIKIEWGGNWKTFKDGFHFQLPWKTYNGKNQFAKTTRQHFTTAKQKNTCIPNLTPNNTKRLLAELKRTESGGNYQIVNKYNGSLGAYQAQASTLSNSNIALVNRTKFNAAKAKIKKSPTYQKTFLNNPTNWTLKGGKTAYLNSKKLQDRVALITINNHFKWAVDFGAIKCGDSQTKLTGYAKASWFGWKSAALWYRDGKDSKDGNQVPVSKYAKDGESIAIEPNKQKSLLTYLRN